MALGYNFSYSVLADVYAVADTEPEYRDELLKFAADLEQMGYGTFEGTDYLMNPSSKYPDEIISQEDYTSELADRAEEDGLFDFIELATSCGE